MFSSITMVLSTTKPTLSVSAISDRLSRLKSSRYMTANVAAIVTGSVKLEMTVAVTLRRNTKMTVTTRMNVIQSVIFTSCTDSRIDADRSVRSSNRIDGGSC